MQLLILIALFLILASMKGSNIPRKLGEGIAKVIREFIGGYKDGKRG